MHSFPIKTKPTLSHAKDSLLIQLSSLLPMAFLPHGPGADRQEFMSRVVEDGALELMDTAVRKPTSAEVEGAIGTQTECILVVGVGAAAGVLSAGLKAAPEPLLRIVSGKVVLGTVHTCGVDGVLFFHDLGMGNAAACPESQLLEAVQPRSVLVVSSIIDAPSVSEDCNRVRALVSDKSPDHPLCSAVAEACEGRIQTQDCLDGSAAAIFTAAHLSGTPVAALRVTVPLAWQGGAGAAIFDAVAAVLSATPAPTGTDCILSPDLPGVDRQAACKVAALQRETKVGGMFM